MKRYLMFVGAVTIVAICIFSAYRSDAEVIYTCKTTCEHNPYQGWLLITKKMCTELVKKLFDEDQTMFDADEIQMMQLVFTHICKPGTEI